MNNNYPRILKKKTNYVTMQTQSIISWKMKHLDDPTNYNKILIRNTNF